MNKKLKISAIVFLFLAFVFQTENTRASIQPVAKNKEIIVFRKLDNQAQILSAYLASFNSPLQYSAQDFVDAARQYNLDWKMLPAIAGVESTFGKQIPGGFNAYGWGVYGTQAVYFDSWREGIFTVAKGLRENYLDKGLTDPYAINRIYAASPYWGGHVTYFMRDLDKFANQYETSHAESAQIGTAPKIAAISGQLVLR